MPSVSSEKRSLYFALGCKEDVGYILMKVRGTKGLIVEKRMVCFSLSKEA